MSLRPEILRSISEMGFENPSPIQAQAIPAMLGRDIDFLGLAGTGTGKTAAFSIPLLERIDTSKRSVQALILCPTRELALQVSGQISLLGKYLRVKVATVYGGSPYGEQIAAIRGGAQIVVGTPGRVIDHLERNTLNLGDVRTLILDEADEMFSMGFKEEIDKVVALMSGANTWLFSATMSPEVRRVVQSSLHDPVTVQVSRPNTVSANVEQLYYRVNEGEKPEVVCKLIEAADEFYGLIFCQTKALVADLTRFMLDRGYKVDCLHGDMDQNSRERTMQAFRDKKLKVLICTDVAARGLDVKDVTHVMNYSLPRELESYVHRIGRTARSGKTGIVMNLVTFSHRHLLGRIENHTRARMTEAFVPGKREIAAKKVARLLPTFMDQPLAARVMDVMGEEFRAQLATMSPEDVAANFIVMMMPDIFGGAEARPRSAAKAQAKVAKVLAAEGSRPVAAPVAAAAPASAPAAAPKVAAPEAMTAPIEMAMPSDELAAPIETTDEAVAASAAIIEDIQTSSAAVDAFGDEIVEKKKPKFSQALDQPPRTRKKPLDDEELVSMLEEPPAFGVVKDEEPRNDRFARSNNGFRDERPRRENVSRSQSQFRSNDRFGSDRGGDRGFGGERPSRPAGRFDRADRGSRFDRGGFGGDRGDRPSRPAVRFDRADRGFDRGGERPSRPFGARATGFDSPSRPQGSSRPVGASRPAAAERPSAPMNLGKPPKHDAGPARTARQGETGGLNRRARRALLFGRPVDGANESTN